MLISNQSEKIKIWEGVGGCSNCGKKITKTYFVTAACHPCFICLYVVVYTQLSGNAVAQWLDHSLAVRKFPGSNLVRTSPALSTLQLKGTRYQTVHDILRMLVHKCLITGSRTVYFPESWDGFRLIPGLSG